MKRLYWLGLLLILILPKNALSDDNCKKFDWVIDRSMKEISSLTAEGVLDDSAPRASMRATKINNELQIININLKLQEINKCKILETPISEQVYIVAALSCYTARKLGKSDSKEECDKDKWKKNPIGLTTKSLN
jgi:hypothetical protein